MTSRIAMLEGYDSPFGSYRRKKRRKTVSRSKKAVSARKRFKKCAKKCSRGKGKFRSCMKVCVRKKRR